MYCVKCKRATDTKDIVDVVTKNNRNMKRGKCVECGSTQRHNLSRVRPTRVDTAEVDS